MRLLAALTIALTWAQPVFAAEFKTVTLPDQTVLTYAVAHPTDFDPQAEHPVLLALPPGGQDTAMVSAGLDAFWEAEGTKRGYIVVSPAAPAGELFMREGRRHIAPFIDHVRATYRIAGGKLDLAGVSNGGLSAFAAALDNPDAFKTITVVPGFPPDNRDFAALEKLSAIRVNMVVGENDGGWTEAMARTQAELERLGIDSVYDVIAGEGHFITSLTGPASARLFDQIER